MSEDQSKIVKDIIEQHAKAFELKSKLTTTLDGYALFDIIPALIMVYSEVVMNCYASEEDAIHAISEFSARSIMAIKAFSEEGLCIWNTSETLQ